jgi:broad specificity phosphatase PhoE
MGKPNGITVHLLRVGETIWDKDGRAIGQSDLPMTQPGSDTVVEAIRVFEPQNPISLVLTSPEESAIRSSRLLVSSTEVKVKSLDALSNVGLGLWEGVLLSDLEDRCPTVYSQWQDAPERITPPEGESFFDAQDRMVTSIIKSMSKLKGPHPTIAIVLRPWAWAIVRCWLREQKICDIWSQLDQPIMVEAFEITKSQLDSYQRRTKVSA